MTWETLAACAGMDTEMFFPGDRRKGEPERIRNAFAACARCPVQRDCLEYAIETDMRGIWGGMDTAERKRYAREHDLI